MQKTSIACPTPVGTYSAIFDVRSLDPSSLLLKLSKEYGTSDAVTVYGTLDSTATSASPNLTLLNNLPGNNGDNGGALDVSGWPFLLLLRAAGASVGGTVIGTGNENGSGAVLAPPTSALPGLNAFSTLLDLANLGGGAFRIALSANQTASDVFTLYGTNDSTAGGGNLTAGGQILGTLQGGGGAQRGSLSVSGFKYLFVQRTGGGTGGFFFAWGTSVSAEGGTGSPSKLNKSMAAETTTVDFNQACATAVGATPIGWVGVEVNGVGYDPGDATRAAPCYFSSDGGTTPLAQGSITTAATLYWVGSVAGFQLAAGTDIIDFIYNA